MGVPKALLPWKGVPLWLHLAKTISPLVQAVGIVGFPEAFCPAVEAGYRFVDDPLRIGPLGGLAVGLKSVSTPKAFVMACDMPCFSAGALATLWAKAADADIVVPHTSDGYHPLFAVYDRGCLPAIEEAIARGERRLRSFYAGLRVIEVPIADGDPEWQKVLYNINTPEEYSRALAW